MEIKKLQKMIVKFRDARDWKQFHNPKDLSIALMVEAGEILEHFQWKTKEEVNNHVKSKKLEELKGEIADVTHFLFLLAHELDIDLEKEFIKKIKENEKRYPVEKSKGTHKKYTEL